MCRLSVNVDHVATLREARRAVEPDPVHAAVLAELGGADGITVHLRGDQRHVKLRDLRMLKDTVRTRLTLEMAPTPEMVALAVATSPFMVTLVPENPGEVSTEGGLDLATLGKDIAPIVAPLHDAGIALCAFVDPVIEQIQAAAGFDMRAVELCTTKFAESSQENARREQIDTLQAAASLAARKGLQVHAGHGLTYENVGMVAAIDGICELSIGHSIIARGVLVGMEQAVRDMQSIIRGACQGRRRV